MAFSVNSCLLPCEAFAVTVTFEQLRSWVAYKVNPSWRVMHQSIPAVLSTPPPPGLLQGICLPCQSWGWGICKFCTSRGPRLCQPRAFDTHAVPYQNITTQRILLEKQADWLICQGWEKIEEVCKGIFSILCMHYFIAYQARTQELSTWIDVFSVIESSFSWYY